MNRFIRVQGLEMFPEQGQWKCATSVMILISFIIIQVFFFVLCFIRYTHNIPVHLNMFKCKFHVNDVFQTLMFKIETGSHEMQDYHNNNTMKLYYENVFKTHPI